MIAVRFIELKGAAPTGAPDRYLAAIMSSDHPADVSDAHTDPVTPDAASAVPHSGKADADVASDTAASAALFTCPACNHDFEVSADQMPGNGLLVCPACAAQFFATAEMSAEDRAEAERMEADRLEREERLQDLHQNKIVLERRSLTRIRSYLVIALVFMVVVAIQSVGRSWLVYKRAGYLPTKFIIFLIVSVAFVPLCWICAKKIRAINLELRRPLLADPVAPPDFSTLSDGTQILDAEIKNLEKLSGR